MAGTDIVREKNVSLPKLIQQAKTKLEKAQTAADVLGARVQIRAGYSHAKTVARLQKATKAHSSLIKETHKAQADLLNLEAESHKRLADEYDAAQANGDASTGRPKSIPTGKTFTLDEAGITAKEIFVARQFRDALNSDSEIVAKILEQIMADGDEPTRAALQRQLMPTIKQMRGESADAKRAHRKTREQDLARNQKDLPDAEYGVIYADPAWRFEPRSRDTGMDRSAENHYPTMTTEEICALPVQSIAARDCALFLWATVPMMLDALKVLGEWGFEYKSHIMWRKYNHKSKKLYKGNGYWVRNCHELLLICTRGNVPAPAMGDQYPSCIDAPISRHSEKPEIFAEIIESYFPNLPKIELNRRGEARPGWDVWGNEAL